MNYINNPTKPSCFFTILMNPIMAPNYAYFHTKPFAVFVRPFKTLQTPLPYFFAADKTEENSTISPVVLIPITGFLCAFSLAFLLLINAISFGSVGLVVLFLLLYSLHVRHSPRREVPLQNLPQFLQ